VGFGSQPCYQKLSISCKGLKMKAATAVIDRRALRHNLQRVRHLAPQSRLVAVVKTLMGTVC